MKITGTNIYMDVEHDGKTARFDGELGMHGFYAIGQTMRWLPPHDEQPVTLAERETWIAAVLKESDGKEFQIRFA